MLFSKLGFLILSIVFISVETFSVTDAEEQNVVDTSLNQEGKSIGELVPKNWEIIYTCKGDINNNSLEDLIIVAQSNDSSKIKNCCMDKMENTNDRVLGIFFKNRNGKYKKVVEARTLVPYKMCNAEEPLSSISINENGVISIDLHFWMSAGSWSLGNRTYKYRYQNGKIVLIGIEDNIAKRNTGEIIKTRINFLTRKVIYEYGNFSSNEIDSIVTKKFELKELFTINACDTSMGYYSKNLLP
ncbi:hypothetical protein CHISP_1195 [Chitinispirillum alkaliphilum]|nr:hypothetical protein CHISP_1195 [Chitinispirillum alkaliphilum]